MEVTKPNWLKRLRYVADKWRVLGAQREGACLAQIECHFKVKMTLYTQILWTNLWIILCITCG